MKESAPSRMMVSTKTVTSERVPKAPALSESMASVTSRSSPPIKNAIAYVTALMSVCSQENSPPLVALMAAKYPLTTNAKMPTAMTVVVWVFWGSRLLASPNHGAMKTVAA